MRGFEIVQWAQPNGYDNELLLITIALIIIMVLLLYIYFFKMMVINR